MDESVWTDAAVWRITVPAAWRQRDTLLRIHFVGDVARLYAGGKLVADKFYNGQPFDFALWRIPPDQLDTLELRVMPLHPQSAARLPVSMRPAPPLTEPRAEVASIEALERRQLTLKISTPTVGINSMNTISKARMQTIIPIRQGARLLLAVLFAAAVGSWQPSSGAGLAGQPAVSGRPGDDPGAARQHPERDGRLRLGCAALPHARKYLPKQPRPPR